MARRAVRERRFRRARHRPRQRRGRLAFRPLDSHRQPRNRRSHRHDHRKGQEDRGAYPRSEPGRHPLRQGRVRRSRAPTGASASSRCRQSWPRRATTCPTSLKGKLDGIGDHTVSVGAYPRARISARSKSIPTPWSHASSKLVRRRRCRPRHQSDDFARSDTWRRGARHRPGDARGRASTIRDSGQMLAGFVHGLRRAARAISRRRSIASWWRCRLPATASASAPAAKAAPRRRSAR